MTINLTFWLITALSASVMANFIAFYYIRVVLGKLFYVGENLSDLVELITTYRNHLKAVYSMEMFYGDETLQHLIEHTKSLHILLEDYEDIYSIVIPQETDEQETDEQITQKEDEQYAKTTISQENVFYAGTRTSNN